MPTKQEGVQQANTLGRAAQYVLFNSAMTADAV